MKIIYSPKCLEYEKPGHPESPTRVYATHDYLKQKGYIFEEPKQCTIADLLLVHSKNLINQVKHNSFEDADTPNLPKMFDYARLSVGGALLAMETALKKQHAFSLMRPPGHHAGRDFLGGFCYFNNIAIAVKKALKAKNVKRIAIIDIDGHHGNGTQNIFHGQNNVLYVSLHQVGVFPMTGFTSENNCLNYPLGSGSSDREYIQTLKLALERIRNFSADLIAVSAGFDTYKEDPVLGLGLYTNTYCEIGKLIAGLDKPVFAVLEGGYSKDMPECVYEFLKGLEK
ncbi:MAG: histone deacetylase, partial [Candidatus Aenigmarchaeota archaeon]|nr:histone deacetylase [Candidatus Aenigmarchaeota archaeon]